MNADLIMFFFCKNRQEQLGQNTVKQQTTGVKIQSTVTRHTHIFFDILRFDSLVWGVCWIESPKGEAAKKAITRTESRVYVRCCFGSYMRFTFKANQPSVLQQMKEGDSGSGKPQWDSGKMTGVCQRWVPMCSSCFWMHPEVIFVDVTGCRTLSSRTAGMTLLVSCMFNMKTTDCSFIKHTGAVF